MPFAFADNLKLKFSDPIHYILVQDEFLFKKTWSIKNYIDLNNQKCTVICF